MFAKRKKDVTVPEMLDIKKMRNCYIKYEGAIV